MAQLDYRDKLIIIKLDYSDKLTIIKLDYSELTDTASARSGPSSRGPQKLKVIKIENP